VLFYEELIDDDSYDYDLIEEMFNPKKKVKISKDKAMFNKNFSDNDYSNDSVTETTNNFNVMTKYTKFH
jgi:hypothetical protein